MKRKSAKMGKKIDMIGKKFGFLTVIEETEKRDKSGAVYYRCKCDCGNEKEISGRCLRLGDTVSCGCYNKVKSKKENPNYKKKLYYIHNSMLNRCRNKNDRAYHNYGGRGIKVDEEWLKYEPFEKWSLENGYKEGLWIDRINNDGNYEPDNCRWITPKEQLNNTRRNVIITINGESHTATEWEELTGIKSCTIKRRIELGWNEDDLLQPINAKYSHGEAIRKGIAHKKR